MILVFTKTEEEYIRLGLTPRNMFKRVIKESNVRGFKPLGIIRTPMWRENKNKEIERAYEYLEAAYPELFKEG
jgi:hypothetical protein